MKKIVMLAAASFLAFAPVAATVGHTQTLNLDTNPNDPVTGLPPAKWLQLALKMIAPEALIDKPIVLMLNATSEPLTVKCGDYTIVGNQVYKAVVGNPVVLAPFHITPVRTDTFDGWCKDKGSLVGSSMTTNINGWMNDGKGNFSKATIVVFIARTKDISQ